jgi:hypothetical protein
MIGDANTTTAQTEITSNTSGLVRRNTAERAGISVDSPPVGKDAYACCISRGAINRAGRRLHAELDGSR